ncbi:mfs general substrate transporter [Rhizoctonia solani]|uniref:Mfs general substrate transporter n=1 Tax=Rhizoctonia solani TaxID=456999 RepID=A0A8H7IEW9_9AGAM|nr:mfs general substrate transporter [Rhizoctonia solani]
MWFRCGLSYLAISDDVDRQTIPPNRVIGIVTIMWGISSALQASAFDYAGVVTARYFMGFLKQDLARYPFLLFLFYLKSEHALRTSFFISAGPLAGAFGGIIALIEGCPTILVGILYAIPCLLGLRAPNGFEEERTIATERLQREVQSEARAVNWDHVRLSLLDYRTWMLLFALLSSPPETRYLRLVSSATQVHARYAAIFLAVTGTYCGIPLPCLGQPAMAVPRLEEQ